MVELVKYKINSIAPNYIDLGQYSESPNCVECKISLWTSFNRKTGKSEEEEYDLTIRVIDESNRHDDSVELSLHSNPNVKFFGLDVPHQFGYLAWKLSHDFSGYMINDQTMDEIRYALDEWFYEKIANCEEFMFGIEYENEPKDIHVVIGMGGHFKEENRLSVKDVYEMTKKLIADGKGDYNFDVGSSNETNGCSVYTFGIGKIDDELKYVTIAF